MEPLLKPRTARVGQGWSLREGDHVLANDSDWESLRNALLDLPKTATTPNGIVTLVATDGTTLSIGIAGAGDNDNPGLSTTLATVDYTPASGDPPYLVPVQDASVSYEKGGVVVFRADGQWTEVLRRHCVPVAVMLKIAEEFYYSQMLWEGIEWEQV